MIRNPVEAFANGDLEMSLRSPTFVDVDAPSASSVGQIVRLTGRVVRVTRDGILLKAKISCTRAPTDCDFEPYWIEGRLISPANPPRRCPGCGQRTIAIERGTIDRPIYYKVILGLKDQSTLTAYVAADRFDQLKTTFPYVLEERFVTVSGELQLLNEYAIVVNQNGESVEMDREELEKLRRIENLANELHSKLKLDHEYTRKVLSLCEALWHCGGVGNRQRLGMILGVSEKTIDRMFQHSNTISLKTGGVWNPYFETESSLYPAIFHSKPATALTLFGQCLTRTHLNFEVNEEREQERRRRPRIHSC